MAKKSKYRISIRRGPFGCIRYFVEARGLFGLWNTVKVFVCGDDDEYARLCAAELLEKLEEDIEP